MPLVTFTRVRTRALVPVVATPALLLALAACGGGDSTAPAVPELLTKTAGDQVSGIVAAPAPTSPTLKVTDKDGRAVKGVVVNFAVANGGTIAATVDTTDASGVATSGTWTLGTTAGTQTVTATSPSVAGASAVFTATAAGAAATTLVFATQPPTFAEAGQQFAGPVVEARDRFGNRSGSTVTVTLSLAGNTGNAPLTGTTSVAAVDGRATFGTLSTSSTGTLSFVATASDQNVGAAISNPMTVSSGPVAAIVKVAGDVQQGDAGTRAFLPPVAKVTDAFGNPKGGVQVTFSVVSGGGSVSNTTATSDANGIARVDRWTLGPSAGSNVVRAMSGSLQADFTATALAATPYHIELRYVNLPTRAQQNAFESAWRKWRSVITGDVLNTTYSQANVCGTGITFDETVDDLVIFVNLKPIDGAGKVLGSAGPCALNGSTVLPFVGVMNFDTDDLEALDRDGQLDKVIVHEMGHVIGIGTIWEYKGLLVGRGSDSSSYSGAAGRAQWQLLGGAAGTRVPVENCVGYAPQDCGAGQRDGHWREATFGAELMTPYLNDRVATPLSAMSVASLQDLGYTVDMTFAESYTRTGALMAGGAGSAGGAGGGLSSVRRLVEAKPDWVVRVVDHSGRSVPGPEWIQRDRNSKADAQRPASDQ